MWVPALFKAAAAPASRPPDEAGLELHAEAVISAKPIQGYSHNSRNHRLVRSMFRSFRRRLEPTNSSYFLIIASS
jgi:hypothetical protein